MRKWMRERLKRRKKDTNEEKAPGQANPAPLQPKYFDAGSVAAEPPSPTESMSETPSSAEPEENQPEPEAAPGQTAQTGSADSQRRGRRRRRGRGGRGRSGSTAPSPSSEAPPSAAAPEAASAAPASHARAPKGVVVLAIGLPGSGKSSWFKRHNITPLSTDLLRALLFDDPTEQRFQDLVFSNLRSMLRARLIARRPANYVDATNLSPQERASWIKLARDYEYDVQAVFFDVPVEVCLERNQRRDRSVPEDVMRRMAAKLRPPGFEEGFSKITVVKVKKKEGEAAD